MGVIRVWSGAGMGLALLAAPSAWAQSAAPVTRDVAAPAATKASACSAAAIREAVDRQQVPALKGCRYDDVSATLMQFHFFPLPNRVYNGAAIGVIFDQAPPAGTAVKPGLILLQISKGPRPETPPASSSASSSEVSSSSVQASQASVASTSSAPQTSSAAAASSSSASSVAASSVLSSASASSAAVPGGPELGEIAGQLWGAIAAYPLPAVIAIAAAALLAALGLKGKPRLKAGAMPRVRCALEPGASRLRRSGPLVLGRKEDAR